MGVQKVNWSCYSHSHIVYRPAITGGLPQNTLLVLRMGAIGSELEMLNAARHGYFKEQYLDKTAWPEELQTQFQTWRDRERTAYKSLVRFCETRMDFYKREIDPLVEAASSVSQETWTEKYACSSLYLSVMLVPCQLA